MKIILKTKEKYFDCEFSEELSEIQSDEKIIDESKFRFDPSGSTYPSENDKRITRKIEEGGKILNIELTDHIIVTDDSYYSFVENGLL